METYLASLCLALEMAKELRHLCNDEIHRNQLDKIQELISEALPMTIEQERAEKAEKAEGISSLLPLLPPVQSP